MSKISNDTKMIIILKTYLYLNGKSTLKEFTNWLIGKELGLNKHYSPRRIGVILASRHNEVLVRPIRWDYKNDVKVYYMRDKEP